MEHIPIERWGKDHWSTFAYVETLAVDHQGFAKPEHERMRTNIQSHPHLIGRFNPDGSKYPTRLKDGEVTGHDDWDCLDDAVREGLLEDIGTGFTRCFKLTKYGQEVASALRKHKQEGKNIGEFVSIPLKFKDLSIQEANP